MSYQIRHDERTLGNLNRRYANQLGWKQKYQLVRHMLGITSTLPEPMEFAEAVAEWQSRHPPLTPDGLLGPHTWRRMHPLPRISAPDMLPLPAWLRMNTAIRVKYNVPMMSQGGSPICWVVCLSMLLSYRNRTTVPTSSLTGGFDPANSSVPNPSTLTRPWTTVVRELGFDFAPYYNQRADEGYLAGMLRSKGPLMLYHYARTLFPVVQSPNATHAVVITGIDTFRDECYINNPWGTKDEAVPTDTILNALEQLWAANTPALVFLR